MTTESSPAAGSWNLWGVACRPTLLFVAAYALSMTPHEAAHAAIAYAMGFSSTLFQLWVNPDAAQATAEGLARFRTEAQALARLQHPNIVQIYDVGEASGRPYFVLEFVAGGSLAQHLQGTPQPVRPAAQLVETLARAVYDAHSNGVIHRDLKPSNILVTIIDGRGVPKIID